MRSPAAWLAGLAVALGIAAPASAQVAPPGLGPGPRPVQVAASAPTHVSVTVYRNPYRERGAALDLNFLGGFALITETRTVQLPAGDAVLRFEGVASGIVAASAVVTGLPGGTIEKNRDARLLSPVALVDGTLGRHVTLRRTDRKSGRVREEDAVIVAGPVGGVTLRTAAGIEALGCAGLPEKALYPAVPDGLSAKPVLSVTTHSPAAGTATVTLTYLAQDFDWSASYVATLAKDGHSLDLFAWLTLASGNTTTFADADVQAVAGRLSYRRSYSYPLRVPALQLACYPLGTTTSDLPQPREREDEDIVVTGSRIAMPMMAEPAPVAAPPPPPPPPEDLGDLKLYRVPFAVTVAARAQKAVGLLDRTRVPFERGYRVHLNVGIVATAVPETILLRMRNRPEDRLGLPLPAGSSALYGARDGGRVLLGTGNVDDIAKGEAFTLGAGTSHQVLAEQGIDRPHHAVVTLTNANASPASVELRIGAAGQQGVTTPTSPLTRVAGIQTWRVTVPANGRATLGYGF